MVVTFPAFQNGKRCIVNLRWALNAREEEMVVNLLFGFAFK